MKRVGYIMDTVCSTDNILKAIRKASKHKKRSGIVRRVNRDPQKYAGKIRKMLLDGSYRPCDYHCKTIYDGHRKKERVIYKCKFYPDQIIHWAIMLQLEPVLRRGMYQYSCGNIKGRGPLYGKRYIQQNIRHKYKDTKYYLQLDVRKFYPSIKPELVMTLLNRKIKDRQLLYLMRKIICKEDQLPIGTLPSMMLANFVLEGLDHYIKQDMRVKCYTRHADDMMLFLPNKRRLHTIRRKIAEYLDGLGLRLKDNWQVSRTRDSISYVGYRYYRDRTILSKATMLRASRKVRNTAKKNTWNPHNCKSILSYLGIIRHCDCRNFYLDKIKPYLISVKRIKKIAKKGQHANLHIAKQHAAA